MAPTNFWVSVSAKISNSYRTLCIINIPWKTKFILTITGTPSSRKYFEVVLFPVAAPPVSPIRNIAQALIWLRCSTKVALSLSKYLSSLFVQSKSKSFFLSILTFVVLTQFFNVLESRCDCCLCWFFTEQLSWNQNKSVSNPLQWSRFCGVWVHKYLDEIFWLNTYFKYWEIFRYKIIINEGTDLVSAKAKTWGNFCEGGTSILLPCNFYNRLVSPMQCTLIHKVSFIKVAPNVANHLSFTLEVFFTWMN